MERSTVARESVKLFEEGVALHEEGRLEDAIGKYREALLVDSGNPDTRNNLGLALCEDGRLTEGVAEFERALKVRPNDADLLSNISTALLELGEVSGAVKHLKRAVEVSPGDADVRLMFGHALALVGQSAEARAHLLKAESLAPGNPEVTAALAALDSSATSAKTDVPGAFVTESTPTVDAPPPIIKNGNGRGHDKNGHGVTPDAVAPVEQAHRPDGALSTEDAVRNPFFTAPVRDDDPDVQFRRVPAHELERTAQFSADALSAPAPVPPDLERTAQFNADTLTAPPITPADLDRTAQFNADALSAPATVPPDLERTAQFNADTLTAPPTTPADLDRTAQFSVDELTGTPRPETNIERAAQFDGEALAAATSAAWIDRSAQYTPDAPATPESPQGKLDKTVLSPVESPVKPALSRPRGGKKQPAAPDKPVGKVETSVPVTTSPVSAPDPPMAAEPPAELYLDSAAASTILLDEPSATSVASSTLADHSVVVNERSPVDSGVSVFGLSDFPPSGLPLPDGDDDETERGSTTSDTLHGAHEDGAFNDEAVAYAFAAGAERRRAFLEDQQRSNRLFKRVIMGVVVAYVLVFIGLWLMGKLNKMLPPEMQIKVHFFQEPPPPPLPKPLAPPLGQTHPTEAKRMPKAARIQPKAAPKSESHSITRHDIADNPDMYTPATETPLGDPTPSDDPTRHDLDTVGPSGSPEGAGHGRCTRRVRERQNKRARLLHTAQVWRRRLVRI